MLERLNQRGIIYDWEIYKNCWMVSCYSLRVKKYKTFIKFEDKDDTKDFINLVTTKVNNLNRILISYNGLFFDDALTNHLINNPLINNYELWEFAQTLINGELNPYRYKSNFESLDVLEVLRAGFATISLKNAAINLKHLKIQDLPIPFDSEITQDDLSKLQEYNINDLDITAKVMEYLKPRLEMRELLSDSYKLDLYGLSDSGIGKELFKKTYIDKLVEKNPNINHKSIKYARTTRKSIDFKDVIFSSITFKTKLLQDYLEQLRDIKLVEDKEINNIEVEDE